MYAATVQHASLRLKVGSGCRNSVGCGSIPVFSLFLGRSKVPNLADIGAGESDYGHNSHAAVITQPSHHQKNAAAAFRADIRSHL